MVEQLAGDIVKTISDRKNELLAKPKTQKDRIAELSKALGKSKRPSVWIEVTERHVAQTTIDPAAETELVLICREVGFEVIDHKAGNRNAADIALPEGSCSLASSIQYGVPARGW